MDSEKYDSYLHSLRLIPRWSPLISAMVNTLLILFVFAITWWIFQDPRGILRLYTPYIGYMYCRWMLIGILLVAYVFDYWPFSNKWLTNTHPLLKGMIFTLVVFLIITIIIDVFFKFLGSFMVNVK